MRLLLFSVCKRMCQRRAVDGKINDFMQTYYDGEDHPKVKGSEMGAALLA